MVQEVIPTSGYTQDLEQVGLGKNTKKGVNSIKEEDTRVVMSRFLSSLGRHV